MIAGCSASGHHRKNDSGETVSSDTTSMNENLRPPPPQPGPAPGQARVHGEIKDIREGENSRDFAIVTFYLIRVDAYGPSTPSLAVGDTLRIKAKASVIRQEEVSSGKIVTAIISYRPYRPESSGAPLWTLVKLK